MHRIIKGAIIAATSLVAIGAGSAAHASVTIDSAGKGFVGKGDVQTALGYNNSALQKAVDAKSLVFTAAAADVPVADARPSRSRLRRPAPSPARRPAPRPARRPPRRSCRRI